MPEPADDAEAAASVKLLGAIFTVPAPEFEHWQPHYSVEVSPAGAPPKPALSETDLRYLRAVIAHPARPSGEYAKLTGISGRRAAEIRDRLVEGGFLRRHAVATGQRGRTAIVLEALDPAFDAVA